MICASLDARFSHHLGNAFHGFRLNLLQVRYRLPTSTAHNRWCSLVPAQLATSLDVGPYLDCLENIAHHSARVRRQQSAVFLLDTFVVEMHGFLSSVGLTNSALTCSALMKLDERCLIGTLGEHQDKCEHIKIILADGHLSAVDSVDLVINFLYLSRRCLNTFNLGLSLGNTINGLGLNALQLSGREHHLMTG